MPAIQGKAPVSSRPGVGTRGPLVPARPSDELRTLVQSMQRRPVDGRLYFRYMPGREAHGVQSRDVRPRRRGHALLGDDVVTRYLGALVPGPH